MAAPEYAVEITFRSAHHLPIADLHTLACDPYIHASILQNPSSSSPSNASPEPEPSAPGPAAFRPPSDAPPTFRTPTVRRTRNPEWCTSLSAHAPTCTFDVAEHPGECTASARWVVGGVRESGIALDLRVRAESAVGTDLVLGRTGAAFPDMYAGEPVVLSVGYVAERHCLLARSEAGRRVSAKTAIVRAMSGSSADADEDAYLVVCVRVLGRSEEVGGRIYTLGPHTWSQHFSRLIGVFSHISHHRPFPSPPPRSPASAGRRRHGHRPQRAVAFIANCLQLGGPVPQDLRCDASGHVSLARWVFDTHSARGALLRRALHAEHRIVYAWDRTTRNGVVAPDASCAFCTADAGGEGETGVAVCDAALARRFVRMAARAQGRICTYVLTTDGELRWTEAGAGRAADAMSKHAMHADVARTVAFAGEFFMRPLRTGMPHGQRSGLEAEGGAADDADAKAHPMWYDEEELDPGAYELVIDNASGTYRPSVEKLDPLHAWLAHPRRLGALGRISVLDTFDPRLLVAKAACTAVARARQLKTVKVRTAKKGVKVKVERDGIDLLAPDVDDASTLGTEQGRV